MDELTSKIIGCAIEVHRTLGPGLLEKIYEQALCHELKMSGLSVQRQLEVVINYKDIVIGGQRVDLLVNDEVVLEIKSVTRTPEVAVSQALSYMRALRVSRGLIINFGKQKLIDGVKRISI